MNICWHIIFFWIILNIATSPLLGTSYDILLNSFPTDVQDEYAYKERSNHYLQEYKALKRQNFPESSRPRLFVLCIEGPIYLFLADKHDALKSWMRDLLSSRMPSYIRNSAHNTYFLQALHLWMENDDEVRKLQIKIQTILPEHKAQTMGFLGYLRETDDNVIKPFLERKKQEKIVEEKIPPQKVSQLYIQKKIPHKIVKQEVVVEEEKKEILPVASQSNLHKITQESIQKLLEENKTCANYLEAAILNAQTAYNHITRKETKKYLRAAVTMSDSLSKDEKEALLLQMQAKAGSAAVLSEEFINSFMKTAPLQESVGQEPDISADIEQPLKEELEAVQVLLSDSTKRTSEDLLRAAVLYAHDQDNQKKKNKIVKFLAEAVQKRADLTIEERDALLTKMQIFASEKSIICSFFDEKFRHDFIDQDRTLTTTDSTTVPSKQKSRRRIKKEAYWRGMRDAQYGKEIEMHNAFQQGYFYQQNEQMVPAILDISSEGFKSIMINGEFYPLQNINGQDGVWMNGLFWPIYPYS